MLGLTIKGISKTEARRQAKKLLKKFGLARFSNHYPSTISGGMAQRIALLRTVLFNNSFLLMDEPFGALDALTRLSLQTWLLNILTQFRATVLFITHDIQEAIFLSERIYVLSPRPAKVVKEIKIPLPRPRRRAHLRSKKAQEIIRQLEKILLGGLYES